MSPKPQPQEPNPLMIDQLFHPRNVVLIGASDRPGHWSGRVWGNLHRCGFKGGVYAVNPTRAEIFGARCYPSLDALPEAPDHLALFVPADVTLEMLEAGAKLGARSATLFAAGFGEGGDAVGQERATRLREILQRTGIAAAGPNCMGLACGRSGLVTIADETLQPLTTGPIAVLTQSGMLTSTINRALNDRGLGVSHIVSCGNQVGLTFSDYIDALAEDDGVKVILCYIEMIRDAERFLAASAKAAAHGKAVVAVKIGGSEEARAAALAHTGAMVGSTDAFDAATSGCGLIRVGSLEEAVEAAELLSRGPRPRGPRVAFMTNSGAMKSLMTEAASRHGVTRASLSASTQAAIRAALGDDAEPANPLDTKRTLPTDTYMACVDALASSGDADLVVLIEELPREAGIARKVANLNALHDFAARGGAECAAVAVLSPLALADTPAMLELRAQLPHLPLLRGLDTTMRLLARLTFPPPLRGRCPAGAEGGDTDGDVSASKTPPSGASCQRQASGLTRHLPHKGGGKEKAAVPLSEPESKRIVASCGIAMPREEVVHTPAEALAAARRIGYPVVMKAVSSAVPHKSDAGLVILDIADDASARTAAATLHARCNKLGVPLEGLLVAQRIKGGVEMVLGLTRDAEMGPVLMVGLGGVWLEVLHDVAFTGLDIDRAQAMAAIHRTKAWALLDGFRGTPRRDATALADAMVALGRLGRELGDRLLSIDINPIVVLNEGQGAVALDALVVLRQTSDATPGGIT